MKIEGERSVMVFGHEPEQSRQNAVFRLRHFFEFVAWLFDSQKTHKVANLQDDM